MLRILHDTNSVHSLSPDGDPEAWGIVENHNWNDDDAHEVIVDTQKICPCS